MATTVAAAWVAVSAAWAASASAQVWTEVGDAGELPGVHQRVVGDGILSRIDGVLETRNDVDMYEILVTDRFGFSAAVASLTQDTQLWLFTPEGYGVTFDDDNPVGGLGSLISGAYIPANGRYLLAISRYDRDAVDGFGRELWLDAPYDTERMPDGPGAGFPVAGWSPEVTGTGGAYSIGLTGASFIPSPSAVVPIGVMMMGRRRRRG